jgi:hypothetical protein
MCCGRGPVNAGIVSALRCSEERFEVDRQARGTSDGKQIIKRPRERDRQTERQRETESGREREREREREWERQRQRQTDRQIDIREIVSEQGQTCSSLVTGTCDRFLR